MNTEEQKKMEEQFDDAHGTLLYYVVDAIWTTDLPDFLVKDNPEQAPFEYFKMQMEDPSEELGHACKEYVEAAVALDKTFEAQMEIKRLLEIQAHGIVGRKEIKDSAAHIMQLYTPNSDENEKAENTLVEIQHMKHLLDMMEKHMKGELPAEDTAELKEKSESWIQDIERLREKVMEVKMK